MSIRPVKNEHDYDAALRRIEELWGAAQNTTEGDELDVLLTLVSVYEAEHHPVPPPTPIEAIKFVMDQRGLRQADLVPFIGSRSKVSEVINGKRPLTLAMIRALRRGLGIPAETLIQEGELPEGGEDVDWTKYPAAEVVSLRWVEGCDPRTQQEEIMRRLASDADDADVFSKAACFRQGSRRSGKDDSFAVRAWLLRIMGEAKKMNVSKPWGEGNTSNSLSFLRKVAHLSVFSDGPLMAREYLQQNGVKFVTVPHLKRTYIDGAVLMEDGKIPVAGMSLRYDRIDNFWFTLLHELAHICLGHLTGPDECIIDDLEWHSSLDDREKAADELAKKALIPDELWIESPARETARIEDVVDLAGKADVHPAVVAGRVRHEKGNYKLLSRHVGHGKVRKLFYN